MTGKSQAAEARRGWQRHSQSCGNQGEAAATLGPSRLAGPVRPRIIPKCKQSKKRVPKFVLTNNLLPVAVIKGMLKGAGEAVIDWQRIHKQLNMVAVTFTTRMRTKQCSRILTRTALPQLSDCVFV
ncbi:hypothetical protein Y1Q_0023749 [Alligator mississippiensis]|uniref:Uncharacterized protein n=1 Tax=Alligator mississippiensis TaxID=8496 RepID=A0A151MK23_ALLMI|nr:hypothetical protein Y1Q_0023749 [Alligator mississippiensis]